MAKKSTGAKRSAKKTAQKSTAKKVAHPVVRPKQSGGIAMDASSDAKRGGEDGGFSMAKRKK